MSSMSPDDIDWNQLGQTLKVLGHPVRLQIVAGLVSGGCNVGRIWQCLDLPQPTVSQHLKVLRQEGILTARRNGKEIVYEVADERVSRLLRAAGIDLECCKEVLTADVA